MPIFRVMITDTFINVEADSETEAVGMVSEHITKFPLSSPNSLIHCISWQDVEEAPVDLSKNIS
jgi:hypothetical protein